MDAKTNNAPKYTPTPEQIKARSWEIQDGWTEQQELKRRGEGKEPFAIKPLPDRVFPLGGEPEVRVI